MLDILPGAISDFRDIYEPEIRMALGSMCSGVAGAGLAVAAFGSTLEGICVAAAGLGVGIYEFAKSKIASDDIIRG
jgi:hypothetical protein